MVVGKDGYAGGWKLIIMGQRSSREPGRNEPLMPRSGMEVAGCLLSKLLVRQGVRTPTVLRVFLILSLGLGNATTLKH